MKYPKQQFELLQKGLSILNNVYENLDNVHPCQLQYLLYQQASKGQEHNALFVNKEGRIIRGFVAEQLNIQVYKLIDFLNEDNFPLYPSGCDDSHIETAVRAALKSIKNNCPVS